MRISIALCTYNGGRYLAEQLQSLQAQTRQPDEIIVCDDGSSDDTVALVQAFAVSSGISVVQLQNETPLGPVRNFEKAIGLCTGDIIFLCDQDDRWLPEKISRMAGYLEHHPQAAAVFCNGLLVNEAGAPLAETMWDALYFEPSLRSKTTPANLLEYLFLNGNIATGTALCFRADARQQILPFPPIKGLWHDHWIALMLAAGQSLHFLDEVLIQYRIHGAQQVGFPGRGQSAPAFREAVSNVWLNDQRQQADAAITAHIAWGLQTGERFKEQLRERMLEATPHIEATLQMIKGRLQWAKTNWHRQMPFWHRKMKLLKHWLSGGEYLRITWKDVISI